MNTLDRCRRRTTIAAAALTAAMLAVLCVSAFSSPLASTVELCVMSRGFCFGTAISQREIEMINRWNGVPEPEPAQPVDPLALTPLQQAALMQMHESHVRRAVVSRLLEDSQDKPTITDYRHLVELGLACKKPNDKWHSLTFEGVTAAKALEQSLCRTFNIHVLLRGADSGWQSKFHCPCGWSTKVRRSTTSWGNANYAFNRHVERVGSDG